MFIKLGKGSQTIVYKAINFGRRRICCNSSLAITTLTSYSFETADSLQTERILLGPGKALRPKQLLRICREEVAEGALRCILKKKTPDNWL
jgi:hypothetical protein